LVLDDNVYDCFLLGFRSMDLRVAVAIAKTDNRTREKWTNPHQQQQKTIFTLVPPLPLLGHPDGSRGGSGAWGRT
jgi:hypothetical protein